MYETKLTGELSFEFAGYTVKILSRPVYVARYQYANMEHRFRHTVQLKFELYMILHRTKL